jgi:hypothetical protein
LPLPLFSKSPKRKKARVRIRAGGLFLILVGLYLWPEPSADTLATG